MHRVKEYSTERRIHNAKGSKRSSLLWAESVLGLLFNLAIAISSGYYLFNIERNVDCVGSNTIRDSVNVGRRFKSLLIIYFVIGIVNVVRNLCMLCALRSGNRGLSMIH